MVVGSKTNYFSCYDLLSMVTILGIHKDAEDELEELMPSCFCLNVMDCITMKLYHVFKPSKG